MEKLAPLHPENHKKSKNKVKFVLVIISNFVFLFLFFVWLAGKRNIDGDEGLYLEAARLVSQGKTLYFDFFYQQMPLLPYLYSFWMKIFGFDFFIGRYLSALFMALTGGTLLFYTIWKTRGYLLVSLMALLFFANGFILAWAPVVKTHSLSLFSITLSCVLLLIWKKNQKMWLLALVGLSIGVGVNSRLTLGPIIIFYLIFLNLWNTKNRLGNNLVFLISISLTSIPAAIYFLSDPGIFIKYNLLYHTQVYPGVVSGERRFSTIQNVFTQIQMILLVVLTQISFLFFLKKGWRKFVVKDEFFIFLLLLLFIVIHLSSAEPYTQYFVAMVPLILMFILPLFMKIISYPKLLAAPLLAVFFLFYLSSARGTRDFEIVSMASDRPEWELVNVLKTVDTLKKNIQPGEYCLTWWPGYAFMAGCQSVPGMENHMRNYAVQRLGHEKLKEYKMMSDEELFANIREGKYRVMVDGLYHIESPLYEFLGEEIQAHYIPEIMGLRIRYPDGEKLFDLIYEEAFQTRRGKRKRKRAPRVGIKSRPIEVVHGF